MTHTHKKNRTKKSAERLITGTSEDAARAFLSNLHGGSLVRMGASEGPFTFNVTGASLESGSFQKKLGLLMSRA